MVLKRLIPVLLLKDESLIKTIQFKKFQYIGDPSNTCRIFNELEVDELCFLDIFATVEGRTPNLKILSEIANECFMPLSYGGAVSQPIQAEKIYKIGFEKIVFNSPLFTHPATIKEVSRSFGTQAVVAAIDVKKNIFGKYSIMSHHGTKNQNFSVIDWVKKCEDLGAGEILLTSIDREGTWLGPDLELVRLVSDNATVPVIAHGGIGNVKDIQNCFEKGNVSAVATGSLVVFQKKGMGVLINMPNIDTNTLEADIIYSRYF